MAFPEKVRWTVCDVPSVVKEGAGIAKELNEEKLAFTNDSREMDGKDIVVTNGALQYIDTPFSDTLSKAIHKPRHILINLVPMWNGEHFYTLNSIGTAFCGYTIFNKSELLQSICAQGYDLIDTWENSGKKCTIPFYPHYSKFSYFGAYFTLK